MVMQRCPHCGEDGISGFRRLCLGPALPARCSHCGGRVGVPWWSLATTLPWFAALVMAAFAKGDGQTSFWLGSFGVLLSMLLWDGLVPLVKR